MSRRAYVKQSMVGKVSSKRRAAAKATIQRQRAKLRGPGTYEVSLQKQMRALVAAKKRDAADITRFNAANLAATTASCLTSSDLTASATSGSGILAMEGDECHINHIHMKGYFSLPATLELDPSGNTDVIVRRIVVWFNKPLYVADANGLLPPITEVLQSDSVNSMYVTDAANGGRFKVLSDRKWNLGQNTFQAVTAIGGHALHSGRTYQTFDYKVKVGKRVKFVSPSNAAYPGGHYDSDYTAGRIDKGLIICYTLAVNNTNCVPVHGLVTRLNYTG